MASFKVPVNEKCVAIEFLPVIRLTVDDYITMICTDYVGVNINSSNGIMKAEIDGKML